MTRDTHSDTWVAADGLDRVLPGEKECGPPRKNRTVGLFYFLWLQRDRVFPVRDISRILQADPLNPAWGPRSTFHWWSEPAMGYYTSDDEFIIRRHAQMLSDAGVDVIFCDVTNALTYDETLLAVCRVFEQIRAQGGRTPQISFLAHTASAHVIDHLYTLIYSKNFCSDLWFRWKGKPLILGPAEGLDPKVAAFFNFRQSWAWTRTGDWFGDGKDKWPWLDHTPQQFGWHEAPDKPEEMCVSAAEHPTSSIGRSYHDGQEPPAAQRRPGEGIFFSAQWEQALKADPELIFITGWNEWVAQRFISANGGQQMAGRVLPPGGTFFVDEYSPEFSRDIEPMRGGFGDNYYYQMAGNIRRFKGVRPPPRPSAARTLRIDADLSQWTDVWPEYRDDLFDSARHDVTSAARSPSANDLDTMKAARDADNIYFFVRTREVMTEPSGDNWMLLFLDTDGIRKTGWEGYDFVVNRSRSGPNSCSLERNLGGWRWEKIADVPCQRVGNQMHLAIPRALLGLSKSPLRVDFKWADGVTLDGNILHFIDEGDVAPNGRFNFRYAE